MCVKVPLCPNQVRIALLWSTGEMRLCCDLFVCSLVPCIYGSNLLVPVMCAGVCKHLYNLTDAIDRSVLKFALPWQPAGDGAYRLHAVGACTFLIVTQLMWRDTCVCAFAARIWCNRLSLHCHRLYLFVTHVHKWMSAKQCWKNHVDR